MPRGKKNRNRVRRRNRNNNMNNSRATGQNGQVRSANYQTATVGPSSSKPHRFAIRYSKTGISSTAGGLVTEIFYLNDPSLAGNWTELSALFDSFRTLQMVVTWLPSVPNDSTAVYRPIYAIADFDSSTVVSTAAAALEYDTCRMFDITKPFRYSVKPPRMQATGNSPAGWMDVATVASQGTVSLLAPSLSVSTVYGSCSIEWDIEFKRVR